MTVWHWLGYANGLPPNQEDMRRIVSKLYGEVSAQINAQLSSQFNDMRASLHEPHRQRLDVAAKILGGACAGRMFASEGEARAAVGDAIKMADWLIQDALR